MRPKFLICHATVFLNGTIYCECCIINVVMTSAAETEVCALFYNTRNVMPMKTTLQELGHLQPSTPIKTDITSLSSVLLLTQSKYDERKRWT